MPTKKPTKKAVAKKKPAKKVAGKKPAKKVAAKKPTRKSTKKVSTKKVAAVKPTSNQPVDAGEAADSSVTVMPSLDKDTGVVTMVPNS